MTSLELEKLIKDRLASAGLAQCLDERKEQYLEFPDGFFAEIVLKDGSRLSDAERIVRGIEEELRKQDVELDAIVHAIWETVSVEKAGVLPQGSRGSQRFTATLHSGSGECHVSVNMTCNALASILANFNDGGLREYGADKDAVLKEIVRTFLKLELALGGESYWDPIRYPEKELNEAALQYIMLHPSAKAS